MPGLLREMPFERSGVKTGWRSWKRKTANPCPLPKFTSDIRMASLRRPSVGVRKIYHPDHQEPCEPWHFVLREEALNYVVPEPRALGLNGSFVVFKKVETDVAGFEDFLQLNKDQIDPELLAAKMCGRWRNGVPLASSPNTDSPPGGVSLEQLNDFEYVHADGSGDPKGIGCPVGAHIRRVQIHEGHQLWARASPAVATFSPPDSSWFAVWADL